MAQTSRHRPGRGSGRRKAVARQARAPFSLRISAAAAAGGRFARRGADVVSAGVDRRLPSRRHPVAMTTARDVQLRCGSNRTPHLGPALLWPSPGGHNTEPNALRPFDAFPAGAARLRAVGGVTNEQIMTLLLRHQNQRGIYGSNSRAGEHHHWSGLASDGAITSRQILRI